MRALRKAQSRGRRLRAGALSLLFIGPCTPAFSQTRLTDVGGTVHLVNADLATLESQIVRKDLPCEVKPADPVLGFDLRFHAGYDVTIPLKELAGVENMLTMLFRVTPEQRKDEPVYFIQHVRVPSIQEDAGGEATLGGMFDLGEGKYHVDWMMRDRSERVCSFYWDSKAELSSRDKEIQMEIAAGVVENSAFDQFVEDPPVRRAEGRLLNVKVVVNFAPQNQNSSAMRPIDTLALVTLMRRIAREPRFGKFSVVAFNMQEQRVIYRQSSSERINFPALGEAIREVKPGLVDMKLLANEHGEVDFLVDLIKTEMSAADRPDALIFAGPKALLDDGLPKDQLKPVAEGVDYPVFYLNYNINPQAIPWRDSIGNAIRVFGGTEFTVTRPRDLWFAVSDMVTRIVESNQGRGLETPLSPQ
jgi:hypothetical protein